MAPKTKKETKSSATPAGARKVQYWPVQKPFVGRGPYPATVLEDLGDGSLRLAVDNPNTGRQFHVTAASSDEPASGCFTEEAAGADPVTPPPTGDGPVVSTTIT